jgi:glycosyltransferase involved in cell wall biosynthesis
VAAARAPLAESDIRLHEEPARRPRFTIITAVYDVEPYLPEFIASVEAQRVPPEELEVVAVDDGSTDGSLDILVDWARRSRYRVKVFTKPNGGQGAARNLGLEHATGEWVTFPDADDRLDANYLRVVDRFARKHPDLEIMAGKPIIHLESEGLLQDSHPRRGQYAGGTRADMTVEPNVFLGSAAPAFYLLDRIRSTNALRPARAQLRGRPLPCSTCCRRPAPGRPRGDALYLYRKRAAQSSTLQRSLRDARRYMMVLELGYLDVLDRAKALHGAVPEWLQHVLIYELYWYLNEETKISSNAYLEPDLAPRRARASAQPIRRRCPAPRAPAEPGAE